MTARNPLRALAEFGQSIWLDDIRREMIVSGELRRLIEEDGLRGLTSNPAIFTKAIDAGHEYDAAIRALALAGHDPAAIYRKLTVADVRGAADAFLALHNASDGHHGFVSLEVDPHLARDTAGTLDQARTLWRAVDRPNVFIKVPGTREGLPAITRLISEGINVNVTLLFSLGRYREVVEAYLAGLEQRFAAGASVERVASVASFFLSRIDVLVDRLLAERVQADRYGATIIARLRGQVAIASAQLAYATYREVFDGPRFAELRERGARPQQVLWASTSTKNPDYSDVKYVEALVGPQTVNTLPRGTLDAYRDHGRPEARLLAEPERSPRQVVAELATVGIDIDAVTAQLEDEGIVKFEKPFDTVMQELAARRDAAIAEPVDRTAASLGPLQTNVTARLARLDEDDFATRLWRRDGSLWSDDRETVRQVEASLGWLGAPAAMVGRLVDLAVFAREVRDAGFTHVVHLGMGGSSLAALVFQRTLGDGSLTVVDTTDPDTVARLTQELPLDHTLFIVASKSGTTTEPRALFDHFWALLRAARGDAAGEHFVVITDPGTPLVALARERGVRRAFVNFADIGGRYSALTWFGLVPAALAGVAVDEILARALRMAHASRAEVAARDNPGVWLGAVLGEAGRGGRDKITFLAPPVVAPLAMWLEQLLAESTGKRGRGLLPVAAEPVGPPEVYGDDRLFVHLRVLGEAEGALDRSVSALREAGQPVVTIQLDDLLDLGQEFMRWEIATAVAGAVLDLDPFDQPDVESAKQNTRNLLAAGRPPATDDLGGVPDAAALREFLAGCESGDYLAILAYVTEDDATTAMLQRLRTTLRDRLGVATTVGYGPRYLHSTGQYHKGGTNHGRFLLITEDGKARVAVLGQDYDFGRLRLMQGLGDRRSLRDGGRRVMHVHLGTEHAKGLAALAAAVTAALTPRARKAAQ